MTNTDSTKKADPNGKRVVVVYRTRQGVNVVLNVTAFERGYLFTRTNMLRERYTKTMLATFRRDWETFEDEMVATYAVPDALWML